MKVLRVNASDTYPLRNQILRPGRPVESCHFKGDDDEQTFHLGAFEEGKLISVASFYFDRHPDFVEPYQYRLRGMATAPEYRRMGYSKALLKMAFPIIKQNFCTLVWCNGRVESLGFYLKVGFEKYGDEFDIPDVGPHQVVYKRLT